MHLELGYSKTLLLVLELYIVETFPQYHVLILRIMVLQKTEFISFLTFLLNPNFTCLTEMILFLVMNRSKFSLSPFFLTFKLF